MNADKTWQDHSADAAYAARPTDARPALTPHAAVLHARGRRVLVMHDDEEIRRLIAINLTLEGFDVTTAADGQDCLSKAQAAVPDILIAADLNIHQPGKYGTATQLRRHLANSRIKVLLISPAPESGGHPEVSAGTDACLTTPFDAAEMIRTVRNLAEASFQC